jgi:hypothetical protein
MLISVVALCGVAAAPFPAWAVGVQALLVLMVGIGAVRAWQCSALGLLRWDGEHWLWGAWQNGPVSGVRIVFDFQRLVLVSLKFREGHSLFLWLEPAQDTSPQAWLGLRRALVHSTQHGLLAPSLSADPEGLQP